MFPHQVKYWSPFCLNNRFYLKTFKRTFPAARFGVRYSSPSVLQYIIIKFRRREGEYRIYLRTVKEPWLDRRERMESWPCPGWKFCLIFCCSQLEKYPLILMTIEMQYFGNTPLQIPSETFGTSGYIIVVLGRKDVWVYVSIIRVYLSV